MWPIPIAIGVYLSPESPVRPGKKPPWRPGVLFSHGLSSFILCQWWLVRHGRIEDAKAALRGFTGAAQSDADIDRTVAMIQHSESRPNDRMTNAKLSGSPPVPPHTSQRDGEAVQGGY